MTVHQSLSSISPLATEADVLMADVLQRVQQPPSQYRLGEERYQTLSDWLERDGSPLRGAVEMVYGQGGVAQGSSIASRATNDEFDVDAMVQLAPWVDRGPQYVLDLLYRTVRGEPGSRYYRVTTRCSRCVQVQYDKMHLDLTPSVLQAGMPERQSLIFHHRPETPSVPGKRIVANPYAFTAWFKDNTPPELFLDLAFAEGECLTARADTEPLPPQVGARGMSRALGSLQLTKRYRNLRYDKREERCPPSVLLAKLIGAYKARAVTFAAAVLEHSENLLSIFADLQSERQLIHEVNPRCAYDVLTDRWPSSLHDQALWLSDLRHLVTQLRLYVLGRITLKERQAILADLYGEIPAKSAVLSFAERMGRAKELGETRYQSGTGRLILPGAGLVTGTKALAVPNTSYFGGIRWQT
jgi:Second Messenger Oligonucleotide or Dinucleotide Synthetase domain